MNLSFERLQTSSIDLYQFHNVGSPEVWKEMQENGALKVVTDMRDKGKIKVDIHIVMGNNNPLNGFWYRFENTEQGLEPIDFSKPREESDIMAGKDEEIADAAGLQQEHQNEQKQKEYNSN
jgi:hypothetical protein